LAEKGVKHKTFLQNKNFSSKIDGKFFVTFKYHVVLHIMKSKPGKTKLMGKKPEDEMKRYIGSGKLKNKVALITGGDSGIGRAVAVAFAKEGATICIIYLNEHEDAHKAETLIKATGQDACVMAGDIGHEQFCKVAVEKVIKKFGRLDIVVNNAGEQHPQDSIEDISEKQLEKTFRTNIFGMFFITKAALKHLKKGSSIINTASVTAYKGNPQLLDYSSTKGAVVSFTRSLSLMLAAKKIRVNGVAPGPIWTPLIPSTFPKEKVKTFGKDTPLQRPGQPDEVAPSFVFLASDDSSYITGQILHPNGGEIING
jgi:NAD(P)-dependent dehydrogenase (short-subunit alcohol dehydrogenase family)